ncbi:MAG: hypothetical protein R6V53_00900, partial [Candidatus Woesearchaeota archaeon]
MDSFALKQEEHKRIKSENVERHEYGSTIFHAFEKYWRFYDSIRSKIFQAKKADERLYDDCEFLEEEELRPSSRIDTIFEESSSEKFGPRVDNLKEQVSILEQIVKNSSEVFDNLEFYPSWVWNLEEEILKGHSDNYKLETENSNLKSEKEALEKTIERLESDNSLLDQKVKTYENDLQELQGRFEKTAAYLEKVAHEKESWKNQYQEIQDQLRDQERDYQDLTERIGYFESAFQDLERTGKNVRDIPGYISSLESELKAQKEEYKT